MKIFEVLRNKAFWGVDALKGARKKSCYDEIKFVNENPLSQKAIDFKKESLQKILEHAVKTTSYYKEYEGSVSIEDFPVINKNSIRDNFENFQSQPYINQPKFTVSTSGSTGTPFKTYQDKNKKIRNSMDTLYFSEKAGFTMGNRLTYFRMWNAFEKKSFVTRVLQNIVPVDVFELGEEKIKQQIIDSVTNSRSSDSWLGYASAYQEICKYLDRTNASVIPNNLKSIIAMSERLNEYTKQRVYHYFDTEVVSRYSNVENGILAQQPLGNKTHFEINEASYFIEILELNSDKRVKDGELGRIVITDLFNYHVPMLRYDTGDVGIKSSLHDKAILTQVNGRKIDQIYNTKGEHISINLVLLVNNYPELKQCQLIQKSEGTYHFKLNIEEDIFQRENEFVNEFKTYLGQDAKITIAYVDEIPLLASGKRRVMVNEMMNS